MKTNFSTLTISFRWIFLSNWFQPDKSIDTFPMVCIYNRVSQNAKVARNIAPWGSFARIFEVRNRSGLIFLIGADLGVQILNRSFSCKSTMKLCRSGKISKIWLQMWSKWGFKSSFQLSRLPMTILCKKMPKMMFFTYFISAWKGGSLIDFSTKMWTNGSLIWGLNGHG